MIVIGVDPGRTTGLALLRLDAPLQWELIQATPGAVVALVEAMAGWGPVARIAVERFVVGPRASRSADAAAGALTRDLVGALHQLGSRLGVPVSARSASEVKPWATDRRLTAAGLYRAGTGMPHARDAAGHALFSAVSDCGIPDPLSKRSAPPARPCSPTGV